jgi:hypothetical protein
MLIAEAERERVSVDADDLGRLFDAVFDEEHLLVDLEGLDGIALKALETADVGVADLRQVLKGGVVGNEGQDFREARRHASM